MERSQFTMIAINGSNQSFFGPEYCQILSPFGGIFSSGKWTRHIKLNYTLYDYNLTIFFLYTSYTFLIDLTLTTGFKFCLRLSYVSVNAVCGIN